MKIRDYTDEKAIESIKYLLEWAGEDPNREGLLDTPKRFLKAWGGDFFTGYGEDPKEHLQRASIIGLCTASCVYEGAPK